MRKMKTGWVAILLLMAVSCQKDDANSTLSITNAVNASPSVDASEQAYTVNLVDPVGNWILYFDWECTGTYAEVPMTIHADGTWVMNDIFNTNGRWADGRGIFMFNFNIPGLGTVYSGTERINTIRGIMTTFAGRQGCFYLQHDDGNHKFRQLPAGTRDPSGNVVNGKG